MVAWGAPRGLLGRGRAGVAVYLTDMTLKEADQRALAGFIIEGDVVPDDPGITLYDLPGGRHAVALHKGSYAKIGQTWRALYDWISVGGHQPAKRPAFVINLNNPRFTPPEDLLTEVFVPI